ncbi:hypothetical protein M501DRAFT_996799 [Patellaria atrata CBS 101060]|uniref:Large ribosomal subunit protein bL21m n=1 Tax=Patellaria atrata CBS 101060 TaxID=1346257 RepID=A0A9P4VKP5_9PEZI|nr:hypothetical protein M501DRAFT_996799 [Patellaria atrata CBS 101060]
MLANPIRRSAHCVLESSSNLPPAFLLPFRARLSTVSQPVDSSSVPASVTTQTSAPTVDSIRDSSGPSTKRDVSELETSRRIPLSPKNFSSAVPRNPKPPESHTKRDSSLNTANTGVHVTPKIPSPTSSTPSIPTTPLSGSVRELLPLLKAQTPHYITAHIYARPYLLTAGDIITLPFLMHGVAPGDILRLNRASVLGSRDYTLRAGAVEGISLVGTPTGKMKIGYLDERLFECRAVVMGTESEPMRIKEKTKRRQRRVKTVRSKHRYTVLRVQEILVKSVKEIEKEENLEGVILVEERKE